MGGKEIVLATGAETHRDAKNSQKSFEKKNELKALFYPTMRRRRKSSRRENPNLLHYLCNWKSICRLTAIFESLLLGSLLIGSITIIWIFHIRHNTDNDLNLENNYFPVITQNFNKHTFYYTIGILTLLQIPFTCLGILGTRKKCLIILCLGCVVIAFVHLSFIWLLCFRCGLK